jgi:16S rRNA (guanine527-N7)-methyltransferase
MIEVIEKYFPGLSLQQKKKLTAMKPLYEEWNSKINLISRKDMDNFCIHHLLHSLAIEKVIHFKDGTSILDVGTGGGFPGIPLAILFPTCEFTLLDSITKKIKVVSAIASELDLKNVRPVISRVEEHRGKYDFIVSRAVTVFPEFIRLTSGKIKQNGINSISNGILYLKGGELSEELSDYKKSIKVWEIGEFFSEPFFETKRIVYLPLS